MRSEILGQTNALATNTYHRRCVYPFLISYVNEGGWTGMAWKAAAPILHMDACVPVHCIFVANAWYVLCAIWFFQFLLFFVRCTSPFQLLGTQQILSIQRFCFWNHFECSLFRYICVVRWSLVRLLYFFVECGFGAPAILRIHIAPHIAVTHAHTQTIYHRR